MKKTFVRNLEVPINEIIDLEVLVIIPPGIEQGFSNLDPTKVSDELDEGEDGNVDHWRVEVERLVVRNADADLLEQVGPCRVPGFQVLVPEEVGKEVGVDRKCYDLGIG